MKNLAEIKSLHQLLVVAGEQYSMRQKLIFFGTGSERMIYLDGIDFLPLYASSKNDLSYCSFELRPASLICRVAGARNVGVIIQKDELKTVRFETIRIKVLTKFGWKIKNTATVYLALPETRIRLLVPTGSYKSVKAYFAKDWLKNKTEFSLNPAEPVSEMNGLVRELIPQKIGKEQ